MSDDPVCLSKLLRIQREGMRRKQDFDDDEEERFPEIITFGNLCGPYGNFQTPQIS